MGTLYGNSPEKMTIDVSVEDATEWAECVKA
jgi:hypothetical protein